MLKRLILGAAVVLLLALAAGFLLVTRARTHLALAPVITRSLLPGAGDPAHGKYLVKDVLVCGECHGADLSGGVVLESALLGRITAPNLTAGRGGLGAKSLHEWDLAVRHGIANRRALLLMPSEGYSHLTAQDMRDVAAYLALLPKVDRQVPPTELRPLGALLVLNGELHADALTLSHDTLDMGDTGVALSRGEYLLEVSACRSCHGVDLKGREVAPGKPRAPALSREVLQPWSYDDFSNALRKGQGRDGRALDALMPWRAYAALPEEDVLALYDALHGS